MLKNSKITGEFRNKCGYIDEMKFIEDTLIGRIEIKINSPPN